MQRDLRAEDGNAQFEKSQIGIAVKCPVFALLHNVVLEHGRGFGVVSIEAVEDGVNVRGARIALVECGDHFVCRSLLVSDVK